MSNKQKKSEIEKELETIKKVEIMTTIKIIQEVEGTQITNIYSAKWLQYKRMGYLDAEHFNEIFKAPGMDVELCMMFPQDVPLKSHLDHQEAKDDLTEFLQINFIDEETRGRFIFTQHATVYIMQDGHTVDKIIC